jgi:hypothetical protein
MYNQAGQLKLPRFFLSNLHQRTVLDFLRRGVGRLPEVPDPHALQVLDLIS